MATWEEISAAPEPPPQPRRMVTLVFAGLGFAGIAASMLLHLAYKTSPLPLLGFSEPGAIGDLKLWQLLTYTFVAPMETGVLSLLACVLALILFLRLAPELETEVGSLRMAAILFGATVYGAVLHGFFQILFDSAVPAAGVFPGVFAVIFTGALRWRTRTVMFCFLFPMRYFTATILSLGIAFLIAGLEYKWGYTSFFTTTGSLITVLFMERTSRSIDEWSSERLERFSQQRVYERHQLQRRVDEILAKISAEGMDQLTSEERRLLKEASRIMTEKKADAEESS